MTLVFFLNTDSRLTHPLQELFAQLFAQRFLGIEIRSKQWVPEGQAGREGGLSMEAVGP